MRHSAAAGWRKISIVLVTLLLVTIASGGFVAGLKAGAIFNTFPLMGGKWIPEGVAALSPGYLNLFENMVTVQFTHRLLAMTIGLLLLGWSIRGITHFENVGVKRSFLLLATMVIIQFLLGVSTLLMQVPVWLGAMHQAGALLLFSAMLINVHALSRQ
jgi:cytochrome c oxidase assembly protein subunit 15